MTTRIAFYKKDSTLFDRLIGWWMRGPYSHCEMVVSDPGIDGKSDCYSSSLRDGGVRFKSILLDPAHWDVYEVYMDPEAVKAWFLPRIGAKYDLLGFLGFIIRPIPDDYEKFFCSSACMFSLGFKQAWRFDPNAFFNIVRRLPGAHQVEI